MAFKIIEKYIIVQTPNDFPAASAGVITLPNNTVWLIVGSVNLGTDVLSCQNARIQGMSPQISSITTASASPLLTITGNFEATGVALHNSSTGTVFDANGISIVGNSMFKLDGVFCDQGTRMGTVKNYIIFFAEKCGFASLLGGFTLDNSFGSITFSSCILNTVTAGVTLVIIPSTFTTTGRIRFILCQVVSNNATAAGINVSTSATIPSESYIANFCSFFSTGTSLVGVQPDDIKSFFKNNRGVNNSSTIGLYTMNNNVTATTNPGIGAYAKVSGTTVLDVAERFTHTTNRLTYNGMATQKFLIVINASITAASGNEVVIQIAKNGSVLTTVQPPVTAQGAAQYVAAIAQAYITLTQNDYVEVWVANLSSGSNAVTVRYCNVAVNAVP